MGILPNIDEDPTTSVARRDFLLPTSSFLNLMIGRREERREEKKGADDRRQQGSGYSGSPACICILYVKWWHLASFALDLEIWRFA